MVKTPLIVPRSIFSWNKVNSFRSVKLLFFYEVQIPWDGGRRQKSSRYDGDGARALAGIGLSLEGFVFFCRVLRNGSASGHSARKKKFPTHPHRTIFPGGGHLVHPGAIHGT